MPVFKSGKGLAPEWCEMEFFEIVELPAAATHSFKRIGKKEKLIVGKGRCRIAFDGQTINADEGANLDLTAPDGQFEVFEALSDTTLIRMCGRWGDETGQRQLVHVVTSGQEVGGGVYVGACVGAHCQLSEAVVVAAFQRAHRLLIKGRISRKDRRLRSQGHTDVDETESLRR